MGRLTNISYEGGAKQTAPGKTYQGELKYAVTADDMNDISTGINEINELLEPTVADHIVGEFFDVDCTALADLSDFSTDSTTSTIALDGANGIEISGNTGGSWDERLIYDSRIFGAEEFELEAEVEIKQVDANAYGISLGIESTNTTTAKHWEVRFFRGNTTRTVPQLFHNKGTMLVAAAGAVDIALDDIVTVKVRKKRDKVIVQITTDSEPQGMIWVIDVGFEGVAQVGNMGKLTLNNTGGDYRIRRIAGRSFFRKNPDWLFLGDSITAQAETLEQAYYNVALKNTGKSIGVIAGGGNKITDLIAFLPQIKAFNPEPENTSVHIMAGTNDKAAGDSDETIITNLTTLVTELENHGFERVIIGLQLPRVTIGSDLKALNADIITEFPNNIVVKYFGAVKNSDGTDTLDASFDEGDGIHVNGDGSYQMGGVLYTTLSENNLIL